jgi:hypothetical protein
MIRKELGFYVCDGKEFSSKILACLHSNKVNKPVDWVFNDRVFNSYDWSIEPSESLDQLYDRRAKQLRDRYDYIIVSYSGGADSHNIVMSFIRQGLRIDEIVVNQFEKASKQFIDLNPNNKNATNAGAEHYLQTMPRLKEIAALIPETKISVVDVSEHIFDFMEGAGDASWVLEKREGINPAGSTRFNYLHLMEVRKRFDKEKSIGLVVGVEKPRVSITKEGNFVMRFVDRAANIITVAEHIKDYTNSTVEFFYWSPDCVPMMIKQGHLIKKYLIANPQLQKHWYAPNITPESVRLIHERILRSLLYTTWNNEWWQADKAISDWYSEFDHWFIKGYSETKAVKVWQEGINYVQTHLSNYMNKEGDGLQHYFKFYNMGPFGPGLINDLAVK